MASNTQAHNVLQLGANRPRNASTDFRTPVIDDGSQDGTADAFDEMRERYLNIRAIRRQGDREYGKAVVDGILIALDMGFEFVGCMDANFLTRSGGHSGDADDYAAALPRGSRARARDTCSPSYGNVTWYVDGKPAVTPFAWTPGITFVDVGDCATAIAGRGPATHGVAVHASINVYSSSSTLQKAAPLS